MIATKTSSDKTVTLRIKTLGDISILRFNSLSDASDYAVELIFDGTAIPTSIMQDDVEILSQSDINLYWEQSRKG